MPNETITFAPEISERDLDREVGQVNEQLDEVGRDVPVSFDAEEMDSLTPAGGGGGVAGPGDGGIGAGGAAGIGSLASRIPKPIAGVMTASALPVALAGGVGVGMLSAMQGASARLQTSQNMLATAWNNIWRPIGDKLDQLFVRDVAKDILSTTEDFEEDFGDEPASSTTELGMDLGFDFWSSFTPGDAEVDLPGVGDVLSGDFSDMRMEASLSWPEFDIPDPDWQSLINEPDWLDVLTPPAWDRLIDDVNWDELMGNTFSWPDLPSLGSLSWPSLPSLSGLGWPELPDLGRLEWPGLPSLTDLEWPNLPSLSRLRWPNLPSLTTLSWPNLPSLNGLSWPNLPSLNSLSWPSLPSLKDLEWPDLPSLQVQAPSVGNPGDDETVPGTGWKWTGFAEGGVVTGPTNAVIGEGSEDEAVLPLSDLAGMLDAERERVMNAAGGDVDTSGIESKLDRLHRDLRRLESAMDVTLEVGTEEIGRAAAEGKRELLGDTDPTV